MEVGATNPVLWDYRRGRPPGPATGCDDPYLPSPPVPPWRVPLMARWACCNPNGYLSPEKAELLERLQAAGVEMPDQPRLWGSYEGWAWRLVGPRGEPPPGGDVGSPRTIRECTEAPAIRVTVGEDGRRTVHPALR